MAIPNTTSTKSGTTPTPQASVLNFPTRPLTRWLGAAVAGFAQKPYLTPVAGPTSLPDLSHHGVFLRGDS